MFPLSEIWHYNKISLSRHTMNQLHITEKNAIETIVKKIKTNVYFPLFN